jgi:predicted TIM-barrel fold metal-dependent hydrolase
MKLIALEEHLVAPSVATAWLAHDAHQDRELQGELGARLADLGERRLADMDTDGVDVQVLSQTTPGTQILPPADAVAAARAANDAIAAAVDAHPERFQGLATLPTPDPDAAVAELQRTVTELGFKGAMLCGRTGARNVDDPVFEELWAAAERLGVPVYIHPMVPQESVRAAYYSGLGDAVDAGLASFGIGWHYETGVQLLRLIYGGVLDRHPSLQIILGHWGEVVLFYAERIAGMERIAHCDRPLMEYLRNNVFYTPGGILSQRYLRWTIETVGADRVMFGADYPYRFLGEGESRTFMEQADLTEAERAQIAHGNWERLTGAQRS